ncbi:MAG: hypothetical protein PHS66_02710 [Candidatus Omnitrophica bacterium]|nr:hypothetical protein [Candidatus Omnitrophota bacterium]
MFNLLSAIFTVCGFYLATLNLFCKYGREIYRKSFSGSDRERVYFFLFLSFLAWAVSSGLMSVILVWGYFTNVSLFFRYFLNSTIGFIFLLVSWPVIRNYTQLNLFQAPYRFNAKEKIILVFLTILLCMYLYRMTLPWSDMDETLYYGYLSKLIAGGRTFRDIVKEDMFVAFARSHLAQNWDALLFGLANDTYLIRLNRLFNLLFCSVGIYTFLRLIRVSRFWSLAALAGFLSTPDLSYLALSLKIDAVVMMFELAAFLSIGMSFVIYWRNKKTLESCRIAFYLSLAALLVSAFAFGNRFSGIIPVLLCISFAVFFLIKLSKRVTISLFKVLALAVIFVFISAPGYWANTVLYGNPIYPTKCFWPFQNGAYTLTMEQLKSSYNITGLPPVILQVYLVFVLSTGLELLARVFNFLNFLPMTVARFTSMGWPYPLVFCIFFWPFFCRSHKILNLIAVIFIFQLTFWSMGLHFNRVFLASTILVTLAGVIMADQKITASEGNRRLPQKALRAWFIFSLAISFIFQSWWLSKYNWGLFLFGAQQRYRGDIAFLEQKGSCERNVLTFKEAVLLNKFFLQTGTRPVVYVFTCSREAIHILFDRRIHVKLFNFNSPYNGAGRYLLINPAFLDEDKTLDKGRLIQYFPVHVLTTPETGWQLYRRAD